MIKKIFLLSFVSVFLAAGVLVAQTETKIARIKYRGGGDWYNDPSAVFNLIAYASVNLPINLNPKFDDISIGSRDLFNYPFTFLTGHGTISLNRAEAENLRNYLDNGGFLYIDDDYGLDPHVRELVKQVFPEEKMYELPFTHPIYHQLSDFDNGLPKVHEHDNKPPQGFGVFRNGRLVLFYTYESNISDAWANPEIHNPSEEIRRRSLEMGANILIYALTH